MKINGWLVQLVMGMVISYSCFGQIPPPNDNFSNRIVLSGTDLTFSGSLADSTIEITREALEYFTSAGPVPTHSVWWSWTAPTNTVLNLHVLNPNPGNLPSGYGAGIVVYTATSGSSSLSNLDLPALGIRLFALRSPPQTMSVPVTAGTEYLIQLVGTSSLGYSFRLIATNVPVIVEQPHSRTVSSNQNVLFWVMSAGQSQSAFTFQWRFNGTNLDGETAPMLALTNVDASVAGAYSVVVSNSAGFTISDSASLTVSQSNAPASLVSLGTLSNSFRFALSGENGRSYRVESSADLLNWAPNVEFLKYPPFPILTSVVLNSNSPLSLVATNNAARKYFRVSPFVPATAEIDLCQNHLQQVRIAKILWSRDYDTSSFSTPTTGEVAPYFPRHTSPYCPLDTIYHSIQTSYIFGNLQAEPTCIIYPPTHKLEEPR